jgi:hypothetical protein
MRCPPVAMRWPRDTRASLQGDRGERARDHHDPRCVWSAFAINLAVAEALNGRVATIGAVIEAPGSRPGRPHTLSAAASVSGRGLEHLEELDGSEIGFTLKAMQVGLWCLSEHAESFEESLVAVIQAGGTRTRTAGGRGGG